MSPTTPAHAASCASRFSAARSANTLLSETSSLCPSKRRSRAARQKGRRDEGGRRAHRQGHPPPRRIGDPLRQERRRAHQQPERAGWHAHLRPGSARVARQEPHEDHFARAGGALAMAAKIAAPLLAHVIGWVITPEVL